mgnify:CR=1 FL=1
MSHGTSRLKTIRERFGLINPNFGRIKIIIGRAIAADIDPSETYPVVVITATPISKHSGNTRGYKASKTPIRDPTPLPPLKPENIGKICPITAAKPHKI